MAEQHESQPRSNTAAIFDRVHKVEGELAEVRETLAGITVQLGGQQATLSRIAANMEARSGTDWKALASWASVIMVVVGFVGTMVLGPMRSQIESTRTTVDRLNEGRILDTRSQLNDARQELADAEQRGRYLERVDRHERAIRELQEGGTIRGAP